jgi:hypothetical protein
MPRHEMDLKVAELTLNGVAKDSVEALGGTRFSSFTGWVLSFVVRLMLSSPDSRPRIYAWTAELLVCCPAGGESWKFPWRSACCESCPSQFEPFSSSAEYGIEIRPDVVIKDGLTVTAIVNAKYK